MQQFSVNLNALRLSFFALALSGLVACSGPSKNFADDRMPQALEIEILPNNSKMFIYRVGVPEDQQPEHIRIARSGSGDHEGRPSGGFISVGRSTPEHLRIRAEFVVKKMGYCRDGFLLIDSSVSPMHAWLKGECKEDATMEDRNKFGLKKNMPVKL